MDLMELFKAKAKKNLKKIVLPEGTEARTIEAATIITRENYANVVLLGDSEEILKQGKILGCDLSGIEIINPKQSDKLEKYSEIFYDLRKNKGITKEQSKEILQDCMYYGTMMIHQGDVDGLVAGAEHSTADTIRPALQIIKTKEGIKTVSSSFIMVVPNCELGDNGVFVFADCAVNPNPNSEQLAEIALSSAETAKVLCSMEPRVAMLSFSTKGSATHDLVNKVQEAVIIAKQKAPGLSLDGEIQADAAIIETVAKKKAPGSPVAGRANVLVFPDLQSGNIGYKLVERLAKAKAIGPVLQGLKKPVNDLSRGCSVEDIVNVTVITAVQAGGEE